MHKIPLFFAIIVPALVLLVVGCLSEGTATEEAQGEPKKVVLIAGKRSHGSGEHEFNAGSILLARALNGQSGLPIDVTVVHDGWPEDQSVFDGVDAIVIYSDGLGSHPGMENWEFLDEKRVMRPVSLPGEHNFNFEPAEARVIE